MKPIEVKICCGMNCLNHGGQELLDLIENNPKFQKYCNIEATTCLDGCEEGKDSPVVKIDGIRYAAVTPEYLVDIINRKIETIKR